MTGLQFAALLGGSILIETIFTVPGMGQYLFDSVGRRDYPVIQAIVLVTATIVLLTNILVDIAYARGLIIYSRRTRGGVEGDHFLVCP